MSLIIAVPREVFPGERRVATVPDVVQKLIKLGFRVVIETGAGDGAQISDEAFKAAGADILGDIRSPLTKPRSFSAARRT